MWQSANTHICQINELVSWPNFDWLYCCNSSKYWKSFDLWMPLFNTYANFGNEVNYVFVHLWARPYIFANKYVLPEKWCTILLFNFLKVNHCCLKEHVIWTFPPLSLSKPFSTDTTILWHVKFDVVSACCKCCMFS